MKKRVFKLVLMGVCLMFTPFIAVAENNVLTTEAVKSDAEKNTSYHLDEVTVTGKIIDETTENVPAVIESLTAEGIERINAVDTSDVFKYMPGSYLRKLYPGSTNRPLVIRGNSSALTARTQVLADGIQISDFLSAGHSNSPKWFMVAPDEIEKVDVIYGPYSAALSGNSLSGTAMITTHFPQKREVHADAQYFYQNFREYNTDEDIQGYTSHVSYGDKIKDLSFILWYDRLQTDVQPISYITRQASAGGKAVGNPVTGWASDSDPTNAKRYILGSAGEQELTNNTFKTKLAYDLTSESQFRFTWAFWDNKQNYDSPESYLRDAKGNPVYSGKVDIDGVSYNLGASTFTYQEQEKQDFLYGLGYTVNTSCGWKISALASFYDNYKNITRTSGIAPQTSENGGSGQVADTDSGWYTADMKASYIAEWSGAHTVSVGYHFDHYFTDSETWNASDWKSDVRTSLSKGDKGKTGTHALFLEDTWDIHNHWSVYLGARAEWWKGFDGSKSVDSGSTRITSDLDDKSESGLSPKFSVTYKPTEEWRVRFSAALADRYPTVGELYYGGINSQGIINSANPDLKPEKVFAKDLTITRSIGSDAEFRLTFFQDDVDDAINSQTNTYTNVQNYQNVDEVRTRGIEFAFNKRRFLIDGLGIFANLAWTDSEILKNDNVPASVGKDFPRVPDWRVKCVLDYAPTDRWFVTLSGHYSGKQYGNIDNSDDNGGYGGVDDFLVFDAKFSYNFTKNLTGSIGVDNITDESYHVSHPYPRRNYLAELKYTF